MNNDSHDSFSGCAPAVNLMFFTAAVIMSAVFMSPAFLTASLILSFLYYFSIDRSEALGLLKASAVIVLMVTLLNPIFNQSGDTVLFTYWGGRHFTLESLIRGLDGGAMFVSVITWFACSNRIMTSDKLYCLFSRFIPYLSFIFTMVLRLVPEYRKKADQIDTARKCIGMSGSGRSLKERCRDSLMILSALMSSALEGSVTTSDSIQSRGYGCTKKRTDYFSTRMDSRDILLTALMSACILAEVILAFAGAETGYSSEYISSGGNISFTVTALVIYVLFLAIPTAMNITEDIRWHILRSGI
jgi:energy-coupling factor transport system permease protein